MHKHLLSIPILILLIVFGFSACYEPPEGCKDFRASNYDVAADIACENCCDYPELTLLVNHQFSGIVIDTNSLLELEKDTFRIRNLNFYLSEFTFSSGSIFTEKTIEESILAGIEENGNIVYQSVHFPLAKIKLERTQDYDLGTFKYQDSYDSLSLNFGINSMINHASTDEYATSNPLYQNQDSMHINTTEGYYFLKCVLEYDQGIKELEINIEGDNMLRYLKQNGPFDFSKREERKIQLTISYDIWFKDIDFDKDSKDKTTEKLLQNLNEAFLFSGI